MHAKLVFNKQNIIFSVMFSFTLTIGSIALAQATNQAIYLPPEQSNQGAAPPPGDGPTAAPITTGDAQRQNVPSGRKVAAPQLGTNLEHAAPRRRSRISLMMNGRDVLTFQPDQLTSQQKGQVMGIIGGISANQPYQNIEVTEDQLIEMQQALAPYPDAGESKVKMPDGRTRSQIFTDGTMSANLERNGTNGISPTTTVIRQFCRYLVIMGAVCGCLFMAFAAISLQFGDRNAAGRIVGAAGGLMLLFMSYAIWKVVRANENNARGPIIMTGLPAPIDLSNLPPVLQSRRSAGDIRRVKSDDSFASTTNANLPVTPGSPGGITRSGLPLLPLGAAH